MRFEKRIQALEAGNLSPTARRENYPAGATSYPIFFQGANLNPDQRAQLDLIRQCVSKEELGGGRMIEAMQSLR